MRAGSWLLILAVLAVGGCDCNGGEGDDAPVTNTTFLSPGFGIENDEPLWPMTPGWVGANADAIVHDPMLVGGQELTRYAGGLPFLFLIGKDGPAEPHQWTFFSQSDEGVLLRGFLREGIWDVPILFLPKVVRAGMVWESRLSDDTLRYRFTIQSVEYRVTRFGPRRVWKLGIYDARALRGRIDRLEKGRFTSMELIEGRGPLDAEVVPLDPASSSTPRPRVALRPLIGGEPFTDGFPTGVQAVQRSADSFVLTAGVVVPYVDNLGDTVSVVPVAATGCSLYTVGSGFEALLSTSCVSAPASVIQDDGLLTVCFSNAPPFCDLYEGHAIFQDTDGSTVIHGSRFDRPNTLAWSVVTAPAAPEANCCPWTQPTYETATAIFAPFGQSLRHGAFGDGMWVIPAQSGYEVVGGSPGGYLGFAHIDASRSALSELHFAEVSRSPIHWKLTASGREGFRIDPDGRIEVLTLEPDGISVGRFDLDLPAGATLGGAFVHEGKVFALVGQGFKGNDQQFTPAGFDGAFPLDLGAAYVYEADVPPQIAVDRTARFSIYADRPAEVDQNGVARVCVPPVAGPLSPADWTMNGAPMRYATLSRDGACASFLFVPPQLGTDLSGMPVYSEQDPYDLVGTIPGVGRVAMWPRRSTTTYKGHGAAALATGGTISVDGEIRDELGFLETVTDAQLETIDTVGQPVPSVVDQAGGGLWGTVNVQQDLVLIQRGVTRRWPGLGSPLFAVAGGGVVVAGGLLRATDAAPTPLPALPPFFDRRVVLADGTQCGFAGEFLFRLACVSPAGQLTESAFTVSPTIPDGQGTFVPVPAFAVGDTIYFVQSGPDTIDRIIRFNKELTEMTDYGARVLGFINNHPLDLPFVHFAPDGEAFMVVGDQLLAFRASGIERANLPAGAPNAPYGRALFTTNDLFVFDGGSGQPTDFKIPRSEVMFAPVDPLAVPCPVGEHVCSVYCYPDGPDDIANGCRTGCAPCDPPPFGAAICTGGACDFTCDAAHPRVGATCSCTALACGARVCGPPDCGGSVSCGTCPGMNAVCNAAGQCECAADAYEPNDVSAVLVTRLENTVFTSQVSPATFTTSADVDRYSAYVMDPGFMSSVLHFTAVIAPGASNLQLVVDYTRAGCTVSCVQGTTINTSGDISCAATASGAAATVEVAVSCSGLDDNGAFDMTVTAAGALANCGAYSITYTRTAI